MERFTISKSEKQTIYEIYRACRLCGAGGGYRMPIIQNIIDLDSSEVELRQKIQECLQLEVRPDDRMPPLICELCVDKINDFYQFLELSRQTNIKTRTRLGLPIQDTKKGDPEQNNCILGVTEPVYTKDDEPQKKTKPGPKSSKKIKKEPDAVNIKIENASDSSRSSSVSSRAGRASRRAPSPSPAPAPAPGPRPRRSLLEDALGRWAKPDTKSKEAKEIKNKDTPKNKEAPKYKETPKNKEAPKNKATPKNKETGKDTQAPKEKKAPPAKKKGELESLLEVSMKFDDTSLLVPRTLKRAREEPPRPALLPKRFKPVPTKELLKEPSPPRRPGPKSKQPVRETTPPRSIPGPKSKKMKVEEENLPVPLKVPKSKAKLETPKSKEPPKPPEEASPPGPPYKCVVCETHCKNSGAFARHLSVHAPTFTKPVNACNPCGQWFLSTEEAAAHHRYHGATTFPYHCRRCFDDFRTLQLYDEHIEKGLCVGDEPPSVKCDDCLAMFAPASLRSTHKCPGRAQGARPGGKCSKCSRTYATAKTLKKHESQCSQKRKGGDLIADPDVLRRLKPMQVRITKCDGLLKHNGDHCDVSRVKPNYGLAKNYIYPYMKLPPVSNEPRYRNSMVATPAALKEDFSFTHWDSDSDSDIEESVIKTAPSLFKLTIKKLFSKNLLGKVPRKRKKAKREAFDNDNDFGDVSKDINDIISSLDDMGNGSLDRRGLTAKIKDIIGCFDDSEISESVMNETNESQSEATENMDENNETTANDNHDENERTISNEIEAGETVDVNENVETTASETQDVNDTVSDTDGSKKDLDNDESTKENVVESNDNCEESSNVDVNLGAESSDTVLESNDMVLESNQLNDVDNENQTINRLDSDIKKYPDSNDKEIDIRLQETNEDESEVAIDTREPENITVNGSNAHQNENNFEDNSTSGLNESFLENESKSNDEIKKSEEVNKQINKESPIKHSIENLIGETDKNPDKYIKEVISSIENIIMNNPRNEELSSHDEQTNGHDENEITDRIIDALDEHIGEKRISDQDKITLEDLLPKENRHEELENISDDDFNFDA